MAPIPSTFEFLLYYGASGVWCVLLIKMLASRLARTYRWFTTYLAVGAAQFLLALPFLAFPGRMNSNAYGWIWAITESLLCVLQVLVVLELFKLVLGNYTGISTLGRWAFLAAVSIAITVSVLTLWPDLSNPSEAYRRILYVNVAQRGVFSSVALFLLLITAFLAWYPIPLNRNIIVFATAYAPYVLGQAAALFVRNVAGEKVTRTVSTSMAAIDCICLLIWLFYLNRSGEERKVIVGHKWRPGDDERLVAQLNALNRSLLRTSQR